jgi:hypothetical protein
MSDPFLEMAEFTGRACGTIAKDLSDISKPLAEAFRRGWREAQAGQPEPAPEHSEAIAPESA